MLLLACILTPLLLQRVHSLDPTPLPFIWWFPGRCLFVPVPSCLGLRARRIIKCWIIFGRHCSRCRQHLSLLPGDRSEGRDMQQRSLDCLRCCNGGWRRPWLAVAAGGAAMASSAGGNKNGGQLRCVSIFVTHNHHGGKNYANFANAVSTRPVCVMPQHRDKY